MNVIRNQTVRGVLDSQLRTIANLYVLHVQVIFVELLIHAYRLALVATSSLNLITKKSVKIAYWQGAVLANERVLVRLFAMQRLSSEVRQCLHGKFCVE